jgi:sugar (pentulose or hexulose) kinase
MLNSVLKMQSRLFLGVDVGTRGSRVVVADSRGNAVAHAYQEFATMSLPALPPGYSEQHPADWWDATRRCLQRVVAQLREQGRGASDIVAGAVASNSGNVVLLGAQNQPLRPAIMYDDRRAQTEVAEVNRMSKALRRKLGYRFNSSFGLPKLVWLARHEPKIWDKTCYSVQAADYVVGKLTAIFDASDQSQALKMGFDVMGSKWPPFIERKLGIAVRRLPRVIHAGEVVACISKECAEETGLDPATYIIAGMTSGSAAHIASGARYVGDWNTALGTTLHLKGLAKHLLRDPLGRVYSHLHPMGYWMPGGESSVGARILEARFPNLDKETFNRAAVGLSPTALVAFPLLRKGECFPFIMPDAEGFVEGQAKSEQEHYAAQLEGIACVERLSYEVLKSLGAEIRERIYTTGVGSQSVEWMQIRADVMGVEFARPANASAAMGSAIIAASRTHFSDVFEASAQMVKMDRVVRPRVKMVPRYEELYRRFLEACRQRGYLDWGHSS